MTVTPLKGKHHGQPCEWGKLQPRNPCRENAVVFVSWIAYGPSRSEKGLYLCETHDDMAVRRYKNG